MIGIFFYPSFSAITQFPLRDEPQTQSAVSWDKPKL